MKLSSFFLFVATGLILCTSLSAQQYHDALAFGLKGNVKECKVVSAKDGSSADDPHGFYSLSFSRDGKLSAWDDPRDSLYDAVRSGGLLTSITKEDYTEATKEYRFRYHNGIVVGHYILCEDFVLFVLPTEETEVIHFLKNGENSNFFIEAISYNTISDELCSFIDKQFKTYYNQSFDDDETFSVGECRILKLDSHGNYVLLDKERILGSWYKFESSDTIKRIITYWDDEPATAKTTQATEKPKAIPTPKPEPKPIITEKTPGLRPATPKELSVQDLITRPFGVLSQNSRKLSRNQLLYDLSDYGWVDKDQNNLKINLRASDGYDMVFLGKVPNWAYSEFEYDYDTLNYDTEKTALIRFGYQFTFDKRMEAERFIHQIVDLLKAEGINMIKVKKYHAFKGRFKNSEIYLSNSADPNAIFLFISYKVLGNWIQ